MEKYKITTLLRICLIVVSCFALITACQKEDEENTNQLGGGEVTLKSFGPSPIQRGAELRIMGANLANVVGVVLPGSGEITDIKRISDTEIRVMVPQDAEPGEIMLRTKDNKEITSITPLTFDEPILINSVTPLTVKAGDIIKIEGDYLNLIEEIIFTDGVHVLKSGFASQSREAIEVAIPVEAQSGKIIVSNGADIIPDPATGESGIPIWVYSDEELQVALPEITKISPNPVKAGTVLTIEGTNFDLIDSLAFVGDVGTRKFISKTETKITVTVPEAAADGNIKAIAFSGVAVESPAALTLVMPVITAITPNPVKNGKTLTVTGKDLDIISSVVFGGGKEGEIQEGRTATQLQIAVPADATDGAVTFSTLAGKSVQSAVLKMVLPTISAISPTVIMAGEPVTITGTNLDLVTKVIFGSETEGKITGQTETSITVTSLPNSTTGIVTLVTTNGSKVNSTQTITINSDMPVITAITPNPVDFGAKLSITGTKLNMVDFITFKNGIKATKYGIRSETLIEVYVPDNATKGKVTLTLTTYDGKEVVSPEFQVGLETMLWEGRVGPIDWSGSHLTPIDASQLAPGQTLGVGFECDPSTTYWQIEIMGSWWGAIPTWTTFDGVNADGIKELASTDTNVEFTLTQADIDIIAAQGANLLFCGNGVVVTKVYIK